MSNISFSCLRSFMDHKKSNRYVLILISIIKETDELVLMDTFNLHWKLWILTLYRRKLISIRCSVRARLLIINHCIMLSQSGWIGCRCTRCNEVQKTTGTLTSSSMWDRSIDVIGLQCFYGTFLLIVNCK